MNLEIEPARPSEAAATMRFDGVDLLRGLSILAVILLHAQIRLMSSSSVSIKDLVPHPVMRLFFWNGGNGVTVFFAISGFLITLTSLRRFGTLAGMRPRRFYRIRFARIAPLLLLLLGVLSVLHLANASGFRIKPSCGTLPQALFAALTLRINWFESVHGYLPANWDVMWSLSVEEVFYLFFPIACVLLLKYRRGMAMFIGLLLTFVAMGPFARTIWSSNEIWQGTSYVGGMASIAAGCLTALLADRLQQNGTIWKNSRFLLAVQITGALIMLLIAVWPPLRLLKLLGRSGTDDTLLSLSACMVIFGSVLRGRTGRAWAAPIRWFGRHSYEVYLTHEFVVVWITALYVRVHRGSPLLWIAAEVALAAPLGWAVARWFSEPMNIRLRGAAAPALRS